MKKIVLLITLAIVNFQCSKESQSIEIGGNLLKETALDEDGMIAEAEKKFGTLEKQEMEYVDPESGSTFKIMFAAQSSETLASFFESNEIKIFGISAEDRQALQTSGSRKIENTESNAVVNQEEYFPEALVYYDLTYKHLEGNDVGFGFYIKPIRLSDGSLRVKPNSGYSWCQQTSLKWCEYVEIYAITEAYPQYYDLYKQTRGWFWSGSGLALGGDPFRTDGSSYFSDVDGPKFTRFGGPDNRASKIDYIVWYDLESGDDVTAY